MCLRGCITREPKSIWGYGGWGDGRRRESPERGLQSGQGHTQFWAPHSCWEDPHPLPDPSGAELGPKHVTPGEPPLLWAVLPFVRGFTRRHSDTQHLDSFPWWSGNVFSSARLYTRLLQSMVTGDKRRRRPAPTLKMASCCVQPGRGSGLPALGLTGRGADGRGGSLGTFPTFSGGDLRGGRGLG